MISIRSPNWYILLYYIISQINISMQQITIYICLKMFLCNNYLSLLSGWETIKIDWFNRINNHNIILYCRGTLILFYIQICFEYTQITGHCDPYYLSTTKCMTTLRSWTIFVIIYIKIIKSGDTLLYLLGKTSKVWQNLTWNSILKENWIQSKRFFHNNF